ncbi:MAG: hypothetical protein JWL77_2760 [Chthonomonadaceae bacterium]|nr:hypothetical protein [Chthonomonadaceae bacterium]
MQLMRNRKKPQLKRRSQRGYAMLIALALVVGLLMLIVATQRTLVQQLALTRTERDSERALELSEIGLNKLLYSFSNGTVGSLPNPIYDFTATGIPTIAAFKAGVRSGTYKVTKYPAGSTNTGYCYGQMGLLNTGGSSNSSGTAVVFGWYDGVVRRIRVGLQGFSYFDWAAVYTINPSLKNLSDPTSWDGAGSNYSWSFTSGAQVIGPVGSQGRVDNGTNSVFWVGPVYMAGPSARFGNASYPSTGTFPVPGDPAINTVPSGYTGSTTPVTPFMRVISEDLYIPTADQAAVQWAKDSRSVSTATNMDYYAGTTTIGGNAVSNNNNATGLRYLVWDGSTTASIRELGPKVNGSGVVLSNYQVIPSGYSLDGGAFSPSTNNGSYLVKNSDLKSTESVYGIRAYPGDYYFDMIKMTGTNRLFLRTFTDSEASTIPTSGALRPYNFGGSANPNQRVLNTNGTMSLSSLSGEANVRFWVSEPTSNGTNTGASFTDQVSMEYTQYASRFRVYVANSLGAKIAAGNTSSPPPFRVNLLVYNQRAGINSGLPYGPTAMTGSAFLYGSLMGWQVSVGGSSVIQKAYTEIGPGDKITYTVQSWAELQ